MLFAMIVLMLLASAIAVVPLLLTLRATGAPTAELARFDDVFETADASLTERAA